MATAAIPPAFVAELIDDVGAYAGIAAIVGLAVLSLLYFTQAREVKRLREWAGRAPEREAELAGRLRADAMRQRTSGAPAAPGVRRTAGNGQQAPRPMQPPGVPAAPATAAARAGSGQQDAGPSGQAPAGQPKQPGQAPAGQPAPQPASPAAREGQPPPAEPSRPPAENPPGQAARPDQPPAGVPGPATVAARSSSPEAAPQARGATPGGGAPPTQAPGAQDKEDRQPVRAAAAGGRGGAADSSGQRAAALRRTDASGRALPARGPRPKTPPPPPVAGDGEGRGARTIGLVVGGGLVALVVGVLLVTQVFGGGDDAQQAAAPSNSATPAQAPPEDAGPPPRGEVNVAVLNGTSVANLANDIAAELEESGFQRGVVETNPVQTLSATTIEFAEGSRDSALEVAEVLGVGEEAVEQLERNTRVTAGEEAAVVVLVGNDGVGNPAGAESGGATEGTGGATDGTGGAVTP